MRPQPVADGQSGELLVHDQVQNPEFVVQAGSVVVGKTFVAVEGDWVILQPALHTSERCKLLRLDVALHARVEGKCGGLAWQPTSGDSCRICSRTSGNVSLLQSAGTTSAASSGSSLSAMPVGQSGLRLHANVDVRLGHRDQQIRGKHRSRRPQRSIRVAIAGRSGSQATPATPPVRRRVPPRGQSARLGTRKLPIPGMWKKSVYGSQQGPPPDRSPGTSRRTSATCLVQVTRA